MPEHRFLRINNPAVTLSPLVRDDSRYVILPILDPTAVKGWTIYDSRTGQMLTRKGNRRPFDNYTDARDFLMKEYPD